MDDNLIKEAEENAMFEVSPESTSSEIAGFSIKAQKDKFLGGASRVVKKILGKGSLEKTGDGNPNPISEDKEKIKEPIRVEKFDEFKDTLTEEEIKEISVLDAHSLKDIEDRVIHFKKKSVEYSDKWDWYSFRIYDARWRIKEVLEIWKGEKVDESDDLRNILKGVKILDIGSGSAFSSPSFEHQRKKIILHALFCGNRCYKWRRSCSSR